MSKETGTMLLPLKDMAGKQIGEIEVSDAVFNAPVRPQLMHQALVRQLANARLGTHKSKTRGEVSGGGRKPWRQKGTGRARQGSTRAPQWKGGGTVFGPQPRGYVQRMPKRMHRAAVCSALSSKAQAGQIVVIDGLAIEQPKTKRAVELLNALEMANGPVLIVLAERDMAIERSFSNLPKAKILMGGYLNVRDLLAYDTVLIAKQALTPVQTWLVGESESAGSAAAVDEVAAEMAESGAEE